MGGQTKTVKIDYFTKNLSFPMFFEITTSNFQKMFLAIFRKFCQKELKIKTLYKNRQKNCFFCFFDIKFLFLFF